MKNIRNIQQGDVLLRLITERPNNYETIAEGRCVIAHGESGHSHVINVGESDAQLIRDGERMLLELKIAAPLTHEEHKPITLEPGLYEIGRVNEYDYLSKMVRKVVD